jgi:hypothetical protein
VKLLQDTFYRVRPVNFSFCFNSVWVSKSERGRQFLAIDNQFVQVYIVPFSYHETSSPPRLTQVKISWFDSKINYDTCVHVTRNVFAIFSCRNFEVSSPFVL